MRGRWHGRHPFLLPGFRRLQPQPHGGGEINLTVFIAADVLQRPLSLYLFLQLGRQIIRRVPPPPPPPHTHTWQAERCTKQSGGVA